MASFKTQVIVALALVACLAALSQAYPTSDEEHESYFNPQVQPTHSSEESTSQESAESNEKSDPSPCSKDKRNAEDKPEQPREPQGTVGQTKPWTGGVQSDQPRAPEKKTKRSADDVKTTATSAPSTTTTGKVSLLKPTPTPKTSDVTQKKLKRDTEQTKEATKTPAAPATLPASTGNTPTKLNTRPALVRPAVQPIGRPQESNIKQKRGVEGSSSTTESTRVTSSTTVQARPLPGHHFIGLPQTVSENKPKREAEDTKVTETKPWVPSHLASSDTYSTSSTTEASKVPARPLPIPAHY